jgi:Bacterial membrane protein YfhO
LLFRKLKSMIKSLWQKAWRHVTVILIFLVVAAFYNAPALQGKVLQQSDNIHWKGVAQQSFEYKEKYGHFPLWTNSMFSGMPAYQIAMQRSSPISLDYINSLFTLGLPKPVSYFFIACLMFYFLCQALRINTWISAGCAIAYAYSTFDPVIISVGHDSQMLSIAYAPGVLAGLFMLYDKKYWSGTALTIIFSGLLIAQSHQQIVYYTLLIIAAIGIVYAIKCFRDKQLKHFITANALAIAAIGGGFASNAMLYLTTYEFAKESIRNGKSELTVKADGTRKSKEGGLDKEYAFEYNYGLGETFTFIVPTLYGGSAPGREFTSAPKLTEAGIPEDNAVRIANGSAYWGSQPGTSGPVYLGAVICCLFILGMFIIKSWHKWWIAGIVLFAIALAWGKNFAAFNDAMFYYFPFYNKFRAVTMALVIPQLAFPVMAALTLQQIFFGNISKEILWKKFKLGAITSGTLIVLLMGFYFMSDFKGPNDERLKESFISSMLQQQQGQGAQPTTELQQQSTQFAGKIIKALHEERKSLMGGDLVRSAFLIAITLALLALYLRDKLNTPVVLAGILLLSSFDLLAVGKRYLDADNFVEESDYTKDNFELTAADNTIKSDPDKYFRVLDLSQGNPFTSARASYFHNSLGGYLAARLGLYQDLMENQLYKSNKEVLNMLNVKYSIQQNPANGQLVAIPNPEAFGPCWLVKNIHYVKNGDEEMKALDSINVKDNAIMQEKYKSLIPAAPVYDSTASIKLIRNVNDTIVYASSAKTNQFAVLSEIYYDKGWNASIDGKKADYLRVDYALRGLPLPAGNHTIEFRFEPQSYKLGNTLGIIGSLITYILLLISGWQLWKKIKAAK